MAKFFLNDGRKHGSETEVFFADNFRPVTNPAVLYGLLEMHRETDIAKLKLDRRTDERRRDEGAEGSERADRAGEGG